MICAKCNEDIYLSNSSGKWLATSDGWPRCEIVTGDHTPREETHDNYNDGDRELPF